MSLFSVVITSLKKKKSRKSVLFETFSVNDTKSYLPSCLDTQIASWLQFAVYELYQITHAI